MGLIKCPDCETSVSDSAYTCPKCNANIKFYLSEYEKETKKIKRKLIFWTIITSIFVFILLSRFWDTLVSLLSLYKSY